GWSRGRGLSNPKRTNDVVPRPDDLISYRLSISGAAHGQVRAAMMELVAKLLAEYAEFQRRRPDLPQGDLRSLSEEELARLVTAFQLVRTIDAGETDSTSPRPLLH